jgi:hypothetical protein
MIRTADPVTLTQLRDQLAGAAARFYRLILVVGPNGAGKTPLLKALSQETGIPYVNLNLTLSQRLLDLTARQRALRVHRILADILAAQAGDAVCLDNIELLFEPELRQDPLGCLQGLSRTKTLVVAWGGAWQGAALTYAHPGHPEYVYYDHPDAVIIPLG